MFAVIGGITLLIAPGSKKKLFSNTLVKNNKSQEKCYDATGCVINVQCTCPQTTSTCKQVTGKALYTACFTGSTGGFCAGCGVPHQFVYQCESLIAAGAGCLVVSCTGGMGLVAYRTCRCRKISVPDNSGPNHLPVTEPARENPRA